MCLRARRGKRKRDALAPWQGMDSISGVKTRRITQSASHVTCRDEYGLQIVRDHASAEVADSAAWVLLPLSRLAAHFIQRALRDDYRPR